MFLAPEVRNGAKATPASDAFSLGVTFYRMLTGVWYERGTVADGLMAGFSHEWRNALRRLLADEPAKRVPMPAVLGDCRLTPGKRCLIIGAWLLMSGVLIAAIWFVLHLHTTPAASHQTPSTTTIYQLPTANYQAPTTKHPLPSTAFDDFFPLHVNAQP